MTSQHAQQLINQMQLYQQQMQAIIAQKENLNLQISEINKAFQELSDSKQNEAYKISGPILIKMPVSEIKKDLGEKRESAELRIKSLEKTEKLVNEKISEIRSKLSGTGSDASAG